jgi:vacuolar-type H+-ATPase subunit H
MRFAPEVGSAGVGGTTHPTLGIQLGAATSEYDPYSAQPNVSGPGPTRLTEVAQPNFYPTIRGASIRLHAVEHLTGTSLDDNSPGPLQAYGGTRFHFYPTYVALGSSSFGGNAVGVSGSLIRAEAVRDGASGLLPNPNSVYAEAENQLGSQLGMNLPTSAVGALGNPSTAIAGLSAEIGAIGGQLTNAKGQTEAQLKQAKEELEKQLREVASEYEKTAAEYKKKAEEYFKAFEEKVEGEAKAIISELLGSLNLGDIVKGFTSLPASALGALPQAKVRTDVTREGLVPAPPPLPALPTPPKLPSIKSLLNKELGSPTIEYGMAAELQAYPEDNPVFEPEEGGLLTLVTVVKKKEANAAAPTYSVKGTISPFKIYLLQKNGGTAFIELSFETLTFSAGSQGKPSLDVKLAGVAFIGDLTFIQTLEEYLQSLGAGDLAINVEPTQISIGTTLSLPSQEVGVFTLSGLSFSGSLELPLLSGEATAAFAFASKENPFTLTVCCFGGGGFAALELGFKGVRAVQAQFEFAGALALNVGVASGSVNLAAGIYFKYSDAHGVKLSGFVRITGQVQILGIVTISAEVNLTLEYSGHAATGTATVRASISVCGFSKSVSFTVSKSFGGSSSSANAIRAGGTHRARLGASPDHAAPPELSWENLFPGDSWSEYANAFSRTVVT